MNGTTYYVLVRVSMDNERQFYNPKRKCNTIKNVLAAHWYTTRRSAERAAKRMGKRQWAVEAIEVGLV